MRIKIYLYIVLFKILCVVSIDCFFKILLEYLVVLVSPYISTYPIHTGGTFSLGLGPSMGDCLVIYIDSSLALKNANQSDQSRISKKLG